MAQVGTKTGHIGGWDRWARMSDAGGALVS
jgi:hypothetical protein